MKSILSINPFLYYYAYKNEVPQGDYSQREAQEECHHHALKQEELEDSSTRRNTQH